MTLILSLLLLVQSDEIKNLRDVNPTVRRNAISTIAEKGDQAGIRPMIDRLARDLRRLQKGPSRIRHAVHSAMGVVPRCVAEVVLHVADERVGPIHEIKCDFGSDFRA